MWRTVHEKQVLTDNKPIFNVSCPVTPMAVTRITQGGRARVGDMSHRDRQQDVERSFEISIAAVYRLHVQSN